MPILISPVVATLGVVLVFLLLSYWLIRVYLSWKEIKKPFVFFEVSPLKTTEQSSFTTTQLFTGIHGLLKQRHWIYRIFDLHKSYSFELVSTKDQGIRYILRVPADDSQIIKKSLIAYLPGIQVKEIDKYPMSSSENLSHVIELKLSNHFAYPIKKQDKLEEYDPIAYITATMTKLSDNELVALQAVVSPINKGAAQEVGNIRSAFLRNDDVMGILRNNPLFSIISPIIGIILRILLLPIGVLIWFSTEGREGPMLPIFKNYRTSVQVNSYKDIIETQIKNKLDQQLFSVSIRLLTSAKNASTKNRIEKGFVAALSPFINAGYQSLKPERRLKLTILDKLEEWLFDNRLQSLTNNLVLSSSELSDLYHFPYTSTTKTENISKQHSKDLPAPLSLKQKETLDIYFAKNTYGGSDTMIGLTEDERRRHVYVLGATGTGKSTMLLSMIKQDIDHNKGLCVVDPHGDLTDQIISVIPRERIKDVVYFNPDDIGYPMGINLLELTPGLPPEDAIREREFIAESIISVFNKIYTDKYSGPRMEYILRNTIHTAFTVPDATLFTIYKLLINTSYRKSVTKNLTDENLKDFWKYEFAKAGDYQKVKMISPITNKIGRFLFSQTAKRILEQGKSTINFDTIMNEGKIILCNLSKGKVGEDNSSVFGVLIMAKIQLAALKRARMKQEDRRDFYLYVDEFQNFATPAFSQILSEARKYRLNAILAHQTTSQIEDTSLVNVTLANTGTVICFRTANPEDERMILPQFRPYIEQGEIASLPSYHFYMRLGALNPEEPFSGLTIPVQITYSQQRVDEVIESSRKLYAKKYTGSAEITSKPKEIKAFKKAYSTLP
ncbi:MAG: hypothetical protein UV00_C0022G0004 [candidate division WWE3 bacterium GW2011_GWF1_42_14]|uniref:Type IV secretion system coupling protein TraD DNA-binding domain-containing protein n=1 Tax=candidate division WWE3 bacterium GW2011_GWF1_42_14 TaxID=1619138 RepID=A0A0G1BH05_UNCKA|nr:MAG: hypothetical protein UV00_C0022G0004 [candidate division WWE3 bacterium GW2011_GWF1_42_14]